MTIVCDTNVLISALLFPGGPPDEILKLVREGQHIKLAISMEICAELEGVLKEKFGMPDRDAGEIIKTIQEISLVVKPKEKIGLIKNDPSDNRILECAADADYIVSGDVKHLQPLKEFRSIPILLPAKFLFLI